MGVREAGRQSRMASLGPDLRLQFVYHLHNNAREQPFTVPFQNSHVSPSQEHSCGREAEREAERRCLPEGFSLGEHPFHSGRSLWIHGVGKSSPVFWTPRASQKVSPAGVLGTLGAGLYQYLLFWLWVRGQTSFSVHRHLLSTVRSRKSLGLPWSPETRTRVLPRGQVVPLALG